MVQRRHHLRAFTLGVLTLGALATNACALVGYDFGDYQAVGMPTGGAPGGGEPALVVGKSEPTATTFGIGGDPDLGSTASAGEGGASGGARSAGGADSTNNGTSGAGEGGAGTCEPQPCADLGVECGLADNGCGATQNCGACFWWFQECHQNACAIAQ